MRDRILHPTEFIEPQFPKRNPTLRKLKNWGIFLAVSYLLFNAGITWHLTFGIKRTATSHPNRRGLSATDVEFTAEDGKKLKAWFSQIPEKPVVILAHGRGGSREQMSAIYNMISFQVGSGWLVFDFRGCGDSDGILSTGGLEETKDLRAAIKFLESKGYHRNDIGLVAYDMGGIAAINMADEINSLGAVVLIGVGSAVKQQLTNRLGAWKLPLHPTATLGLLFSQLVTGRNLGLPLVDTQLRRLSVVPIMLVGGSDDPVVPTERLQQMAKLIPSQKCKVQICHYISHSDLVRARNKDVFGDIAKFLRARLIRD